MPDCSCTHSSLPASSVKDLIPLAGVFKALGHPVRLMIVEMLLDGGTLRLRTAKRFRARYVHDFQPLECVEEQSCALL